MTQLLDVAVRRDLIARWCTLAEQRLQYLTDMFESGRWRRYYGDRAFLENIKEAKRAVETWRALAAGRPIGRSDDAPALLRQEREPEAPSFVNAPTEAAFVDIDLVVEEAPSRPEVDLVALEKALLAPPPPMDLALMEERYPHLRNALL